MRVIGVTSRLHEVTTSCRLRRSDSRLDASPAGVCILDATACGHSGAALDRTWTMLCCAGGDGVTGDRGPALPFDEGHVE